MTWHRWYRYVQITPVLTQAYNFIGGSHYMTEELLVQLGIDHQLSLFHAFPHISASDFNMIHTGNKGLEAVHGIFHGGAASLPITAPNLSFLVFLSKMNQTSQICAAEHNLKGHSIVASNRKKMENLCTI